MRYFHARLRALLLPLYESARVLREPACFMLAAASAVALFAAYLFIPVWLVPGNSLAFELSRISPLQYGLLAALAAATGAIVALEVFSFRRLRAVRATALSESGAGIFASMVGGVLAAASCGCGIGILLGVLGFGGGTFFVAANQTIIVLAMLALVLFGLYFSARRAAGVCVACRV